LTTPDCRICGRELVGPVGLDLPHCDAIFMADGYLVECEWEAEHCRGTHVGRVGTHHVAWTDRSPRLGMMNWAGYRDRKIRGVEPNHVGWTVYDPLTYDLVGVP
jgi:hypothetical protein